MTRVDADRCPSDEGLSAYVDGELSLEARSLLAEHLKACPRCRERMQGLQRTSAAFRRLFQAAAEEMWVPETVSGLSLAAAPRRRLVVGFAAAAAVVAVLTLFAFLPPKVPETPAPLPESKPTAGIASAGSEVEAGEIVFAPSSTPLRADTLPLALTGDVDAQIQLCRLGLNGDLLRPGRKPSWPSAPLPAIEEMEARRRRFAALAQRVMGAER